MGFRLLLNEDFEELIALYIAMYKKCYPKANAFLAINTLISEINTRIGFMAYGLFDENNKLIGITTGYQSENKLFYFSGFYVIMKNTKNTEKLIVNSLQAIEELGFERWECDTHNKNMQSMLEKFGATVKSVRLGKEF